MTDDKPLTIDEISPAAIALSAQIEALEPMIRFRRTDLRICCEHALRAARYGGGHDVLRGGSKPA